MRNIIQKFFGLFGLKLIRLKSRKSLPKACVDNIEIVVRFYKMMRQKITLIQVGACDGETSDSVYSYIKSGDINAYLVEPSAVNFQKLKQFYSDGSNATLINAAIADKDEHRTFYSIKDEGRWKDNAWARQLASFYKEHLVKHGIREEEINKEEVTCYTLQTIIDQQNIKNLDVLLIDTEGYDAEIVKMALNQNITPNFIAFENVQIFKLYSQKQLNDFYAILSNRGYVWTHDRINTLAVRKDFFNI